MNLYKTGSLFNEGMKIMCWSEKSGGIGWQRGCKNIVYQKNKLKKNEKQSFYTLSFSYDFED